MSKGRDLSPRTDGTRSRMLQLYVTPEKWAWVDNLARKHGTSKSEILRFLLNAGMTQLKGGGSKGVRK